MTAPNIFLVGAMKAGTTGLYDALDAHPQVFCPPTKEPNVLHTAADTAAARAHYRQLFSQAADHQLRCDGSTHYTQRPKFESSADLARAVAGDDARVVYVVRDPVERLLSHHRHMLRYPNVPPRVADAVDWTNELMDFGRYEWQIEPWIDAFGRDAVHLVCFEELVADAAPVLAGVFRFLDIDASDPRYAVAAVTSKPNATGDASVTNPLVRRALRTPTAHGVLARAPKWARRGVRKVVARRSAAEQVVSDADRQRIRDAYIPTTRAVEALLGRPTPWSAA